MSNVFTGNISDLVTEEEYLANKPTIGKELKKGIGRGIDLLQANAYGALAAHADVAKANTVRDWAEKGQQSNMQEAAQNPAAEPSFTGLGKAYTDGGIANGIGRTGLWAAGVVGELAPQGAAAMASGAIGKRLGGGAGSAGLMMANNVAQETGSIYGDILEKTGKMEGATAIEYGIPAALIDTAVEAVPVGKVLGSGLGSGSVIKDVAKAGVKQLVTEAPTEAIQTGIERAAVTSVDPDQQTFTPEGWKEIIDSAAAGGIGGAVSGAGAEGIGRGLQTLTQNRSEEHTSEGIGRGLQTLTQNQSLRRRLILPRKYRQIQLRAMLIIRYRQRHQLILLVGLFQKQLALALKPGLLLLKPLSRRHQILLSKQKTYGRSKMKSKPIKKPSKPSKPGKPC